MDYNYIEPSLFNLYFSLRMNYPNNCLLDSCILSTMSSTVWKNHYPLHDDLQTEESIFFKTLEQSIFAQAIVVTSQEDEAITSEVLIIN